MWLDVYLRVPAFLRMFKDHLISHEALWILNQTRPLLIMFRQASVKTPKCLINQSQKNSLARVLMTFQNKRREDACWGRSTCVVNHLIAFSGVISQSHRSSIWISNLMVIQYAFLPQAWSDRTQEPQNVPILLLDQSESSNEHQTGRCQHSSCLLAGSRDT